MKPVFGTIITKRVTGKRIYAASGGDGKVMKAAESHHETASTARSKSEDASEMLVVTPGEKQNGDVSKQYQNREDLEKAYNEAKVSEAQLADSEARLQTIIDMVPSFLWTSLPDGSKEDLTKRWYHYPGLSLLEGQAWGWKVVVHPEDVRRLVQEKLAIMDAR